MSSGSKAQTVGYWYRPTFEVVPCAGPVDAIKAIEAGSVLAWAGNQAASGEITIDRPALWGGESSEGGVQGDLSVRMGDGAQAALEDGQQHRGVLSLRWGGGRFGAMNPYPKPFAVLVERIVSSWYSAKARIALPGVMVPGASFIENFGAGLDPYTVTDPSFFSVVSTPYGNGVRLTNLADTTVDGRAIRTIPAEKYTSVSFKGRVDVNAAGAEGVDADILFVIFESSAGGTGITVALSRDATGTGSNERPSINDVAVGAAPLIVGEWYRFDFTLDWHAGSAAFMVTRLADDSVFASGTTTTITVASIDTIRLEGDIAPSERLNDAGTVADIRLDTDVPLVAINPAHLLRYTLASPTMQGEPDTLIDDAAFEDAADIFYSEGLGVCTLWDPDQETVEALRARICDAAGAACSRRPSDGKWTLRAIRGASGTLPVLTDDDIIDLQAEPGVLDDAVNQLSVRWLDVVTHEERTTAPIHALGAEEANANAQTLEYMALPTEPLALRKAEAELRARATPIARLTLTCTRKPWAWLRGDYFELQAPRHGIVSMVCMVGDIDRGTLRSGAIKITALQDVYSLPATSYVQTQGAPSSAPATPVPVAESAFIEAPYAELVQVLSPGDLSVLAADAGYIMSAAVRPAAGLHNYRLLTRPSGGTYEDRGIVEWCPAATVVGASGYRDTAFTLSGGSLLDRVTIGTAALWGGTEIVRVDVLNVGTGAVTLGRGCWDTVPRKHSAGERILFFDRWSGTDSLEYVDGEVVNAKQLPRTGTAALPESAAPQLSITLDSRANRPYPPAGFEVNGETDPVSEAAPLVCTWVHRDRLLQGDMLVDTAEAGVGPEAGTTYTLEASDADTDEVLHTETGITGTTFAVTSLMIDFDRDVRLRLWSVRSGLASAQQHDLVVTVTGLGGPVFSTWNAADKDADVTLSGADDLVASITAPAQGGVRGTLGRDASGDWYFEITVGATDGRVMVGISQAGSSLIFPGFDANGRGYWGNSGQKYVSNSGSSYGATFGSDVIGVRLNAGVLTFYKNGTSQGSADAGLTGTWYPMVGTDTSVSGTRTATLNVGASAFGSLPSGSTAWG